METRRQLDRLGPREKIALARRMLLASGESEGQPARLRAFVRLHNGESARKESDRSLREFLSERLPAHMIPAEVVTVAAWPRLPNGKVDRQKLLLATQSAPPREASPQPSAPAASIETDAERTLCAVVSEVVGAKVSPTRGRYYELGGDSIMAMRVISRMRARGWALSIRELVSAHCMRDCAARMERHAPETAEVSVRRGKLGVLPLHRWLLRQGAAAAFYSQSQSLEFEERADQQLVGKALARLVREHDVLRAVLRDGELWLDDGEPRWDGFSFFDWSAANDAEARVRAEMERLQRSFDLKAGPLFTAALFRCADADHLFLLAHHLVIDGVSWRILLEDFHAAHEALRLGREPMLPPRTGSFAAWSEGLETMARAGRFDGELPHWNAVVGGRELKLPGGDARASGLLEETDATTIELDRETTRALLGEGVSAFQLRPDDVLLGALGLALRDWLGGEKFVVDVEGHGREEPDGLRADLSRVIGWFTSMHPVKLEVRAEPVGDYLARTRDALRAAPAGGIGYGVLVELRGLPSQQRAVLESERAIVFNFLGSFDREIAKGGWKTSRFVASAAASGKLAASHALALNAVEREGRLTIAVTSDRRRCSAAEARRFADAYRRQLESIARHLAEPANRPHTASHPALRGSGPGAVLLNIPEMGGFGFLPPSVAARIEGERPYFDGFQYRGLDGRLPPRDRVEDIAADLIAQLQVVQPHGPYCMMGYCLGGLVAYEMARQLDSIGETVTAVVMWDTAPATYLRRRTRREVIRGAMRRVATETPRGWVRFVGTRLDYFRARLRERWIRAKALAGFKIPEPTAEQKVHAAASAAVGVYRPKPYRGRIMRVRTPCDRILQEPKSDDGWDGALLGHVEFVPFACSHFDLIKEPVIHQLAEKTAAFLREADAAYAARRS